MWFSLLKTKIVIIEPVNYFLIKTKSDGSKENEIETGTIEEIKIKLKQRNYKVNEIRIMKTKL